MYPVLKKVGFCLIFLMLMTGMTAGIIRAENLGTGKNSDVYTKAVGWVETPYGNRYREAGGDFAVNKWLTIGKYRFHFNSKGYAERGWHQIEGRDYYLKKTGVPGIQGAMLKGWQTLGGRDFYFYRGSGASYGKMLTGFQTIGKYRFYFKKTGPAGYKGAMLKGWQTLSGNKYYFKMTGNFGLKGAMFRGWQKIGAKSYYFQDNGVYQPGLRRRKIALDAGHQKYPDYGKEPIGPGSSIVKQKVTGGTFGRWSGLKEYQLSLTVARRLKAVLETRGYEVYMIRSSHDVNISGMERSKRAGAAGADVLISLHANTSSNVNSRGALTMAPTSANPYMDKALIKKSNRLATYVLDTFCMATNVDKRGVSYTDSIPEINWSDLPVTVVEMGYMSNKADDLLMANSLYQDRMARGIADGIDDYFDI